MTFKMKTVLCVLLWSLVEVHSQTEYPYVSFMGENLTNHAYVNLTLVGPDDTDGSHNTVRCNTDLETCCGGSQGPVHRGEWYFPDGGPVPTGAGNPIYKNRDAQRVILRRRNDAMGEPSGIYHCEVGTNAVHNNNDDSLRETVYVGLYPSSGGDISIPDGVTLSGNTLTCISTGGPATTVTWTRDSVTVTEGTETVLDDPETAQYTHTLTVTSAGEYTCTVTNDKPSSQSATINIPGASPPSDVTAVQTGATSINVTWTPSSPLGDTTGYIIYYTSASDSDSDSDSDSGNVTVSGGSTDMRTLTDLQNGQTYTISIRATSDGGFPSESVMAMDVIRLVPGQPTISVGSPTATTIPITITPDSGGVVTSYEVMWRTDDIGGCSGGSDTGSTTITGGSTSYDIMELEEDSSYTITVTASNSAGSSEVSNTVTVMTLEAAPTGPPTSVMTTSTPNTITVQWGPVDCVDQNGEITGYSVRYGKVGSTEGERTVEMVTDRQATISGLTPSTEYTVSVAAVNSEGTGVYSNEVVQQTDDALSVSLDSSSTTSLTISWTLADGLTATDYTISYSNTDCPTDTYDDITGISPSLTMYTLTGLEEGTDYYITVTVSLSDGGTGEDSLTATTMTVAPSAPPTSVSVSEVNSSSITVQWGPVDCIHRNGNITGYSVQYGEVGSGSTQTRSVSGGSTTGATISGLMSSTTYSIQVAAVSNAGTGPYSVPTVQTTHIIASAPTNVMAVQDSATSIKVTWTPPNPLGDTTGYRISYTGGSSGNVDVIGGSTNEHTLTGLQSGTTYTISIVATSQDQPSTAIVLELTLALPPDQPRVSVVSISATSISLSWSVASGSVVTSSEVVWQVVDSSGAFGSSGSLTGTSYTIKGLESTTIYTITVTVSNTAGSTDSQPIIVSTVPDPTTEEAENIGPETDNTPAIIGGVVAIVLIIVAAITLIVIVFLRRNYRPDYKMKAEREVADIPGSDKETVELSKFPEENAHVDPDALMVTTNEAYNVVTQNRGATEAEYETLS